MMAVIAFVAKEFGYIKKPDQKSEEGDKKKDGSQREVSISQPNLTNLMGGLFERMGPQIEGMFGELAKGSSKSSKRPHQSESNEDEPQRPDVLAPILTPVEIGETLKEKISFE